MSLTLPLWQRRPRNVLLVMVLLLLLGSRRVYRDIVSVPVDPRVKSVGPSRGKTIIIIISRGLLLLSKINPSVGRMAEAVPASNLAVRALAKAPFATPEPISVRVPWR